MTRFGRMPLFTMQTAARLRAEGRQINRERLMADIKAGHLPLKPPPFEYHPCPAARTGKETSSS